MRHSNGWSGRHTVSAVHARSGGCGRREALVLEVCVAHRQSGANTASAANRIVGIGGWSSLVLVRKAAGYRAAAHSVGGVRGGAGSNWPVGLLRMSDRERRGVRQFLASPAPIYHSVSRQLPNDEHWRSVVAVHSARTYRSWAALRAEM